MDQDHTITCKKCGDVVASKRALTRHLRSRHPRTTEGIVEDSQCMLPAKSTSVPVPAPVANSVELPLVDTHDSSMAGLEIGVEQPQVESAVVPQNHPNQLASKADGRSAALRRNRTVIDDAVRDLLRDHMRDRSTLSKPTLELVDKLRQKYVQARLPREVYIGVVVAAKHFAGKKMPIRAVQLPRRPHCGSNPRPRLGSSVEKVKRQLFVDPSDVVMESGIDSSSTESGSVAAPKRTCTFHGAVSKVSTDVIDQTDSDEQPKSTSDDQGTSEVMVEVTLVAVQNQEELSVSQPVNDADEEWRMNIWHSYGTGEVQLPSPFGCQMSPAVIFENSDERVDTPVELWSSSSDDEPWGPDSPLQHLEADTLECVPQWPRFTDDNGCLLVHGGTEWTRRKECWQQERTTSHQRNKKKRRHHCRARRTDREQYKQAVADRRQLTMDWDVDAYRRLRFDDVKLPSPSESESSLLRLRRRLLMSGTLPKGCRIQPSRATKRRLNEDSAMAPEPTVQSSIPEIFLTVSDDEL